jgi:hypothetical protein
MSRVSYSEDEDYPGQFGIWNANVMRSVGGLKGQAVMREMEAALLALPDKRLVAHAVACDGDVCAVGAFLALKKARAEQLSMAEAIDALEAECGGADDQAYDETDQRGIEAGMPRLVAWKLVALNDIEIDEWKYVHGVQGPLTRERAEYGYRDYRGMTIQVPVTAEERYTRVLAWVREQIA